MRRLADDLKEIIERMNAASRQHEASADPVSSAFRIRYVDKLNFHKSFKDRQDCSNLERPYGFFAVGGVKLHCTTAQVGRFGAWTGPAAKRSRSELPFCLVLKTTFAIRGKCIFRL